jgi:hypothetical protein
LAADRPTGHEVDLDLVVFILQAIQVVRATIR